jgi:hypothetical protein
MGMLAENDAQEMSSDFLDQRGIGVDNHAIACRRSAGRGETWHPLNFHSAQAAGSEGGEVRVSAQRGDIDICPLRRLKHGHFSICLNLRTINAQGNIIHPIPHYN